MASVRETSSRTIHHHGQLRRNAIGLPAILFLLVTSAAPLYAMMSNVPGEALLETSRATAAD